MASYTVVQAKTALVNAISTALATAGSTGGQVPTFYAWNAEVTDESVFLGGPSLGDDVVARTVAEFSSPVAEFTSLHTGSYRVDGTVWSFRPDVTPDAAADAETRTSVLWELVRDALAPLSWVGDMTVEFRLRPFQSGWAAEAAFTVQVHSILT